MGFSLIALSVLCINRIIFLLIVGLALAATAANGHFGLAGVATWTRETIRRGARVSAKGAESTTLICREIWHANDTEFSPIGIPARRWKDDSSKGRGRRQSC